MKTKTFKFLTCVQLVVSALLIASEGVAQESSPLSPAFLLMPAQISSTTAVTYAESHFDVERVIENLGTYSISPEVHGMLVMQSLWVGLPEAWEMGVSGKYSDVRTTEPRIIRVTDGFSNPTISARKTWGADADAQIKLTVSATPKTGEHGLRALPTSYAAGIGGVLITPSGLVTDIGVARHFKEGGLENSTTVQVGMYKAFAGYFLNVEGVIQAFDHQDPGATTSGLDTLHTLSAVIGRQVSERAWLQLAYKYSGGDYQTRVIRAGETLDASYNTHQLGMSLKVLF